MSLPEENLDNRTFDELVKDAITRIPVYAPEWTDHNIHDPGRTFIELFAWLAEMQMYSLNRISDKSRRKFLKLMGIKKLEPACASEVDVTFSLKQGIGPRSVPTGTIVASGEPGKDIFFEISANLNVADAQLTKVLSHPKGGEFIDNSDANRNENVYYYAFRSEPDADDEMYLGFDRNLSGEITLAFYLFEENQNREEETPDLIPSGTVIWKYYAGGIWRTAEVSDETVHLTASGKIRIDIKEAMERTVISGADLYWLRCKVVEAEYDIPPRIDTILLNTVPAVQRLPFKDLKFSATGLPDHCLELKAVPVLDSTLVVRVNGELWSEVEDFDASDPGEGHYTVDAAKSRVTFGDGINGRIPPEGKDNIIMSYYSGGGAGGNVKPFAINRVLGELADEVNVKNWKAASGGKEAETLEEAINRIRIEMKKVTRAVTSLDYEHLARNTPGLWVKRARAIPRYHPGQPDEVPGIITVIVVPGVISGSPKSRPVPSRGFMSTVYRHLDRHRLLTTELFVMPPEYMEISVDAKVKIKPKSVPETVAKAVKEKLRTFLDPIEGGVEGTGWEFGRSVYLSEIYQLIDGVEGVDYVKSVTLKKEGKEHTGDIDIAEHSLVYSGDCNIKAEE